MSIAKACLCIEQSEKNIVPFYIGFTKIQNSNLIDICNFNYNKQLKEKIISYLQRTYHNIRIKNNIIELTLQDIKAVIQIVNRYCKRCNSFIEQKNINQLFTLRWIEQQLNESNINKIIFYNFKEENPYDKTRQTFKTRSSQRQNSFKEKCSAFIRSIKENFKTDTQSFLRNVSKILYIRKN